MTIFKFKYFWFVSILSLILSLSLYFLIPRNTVENNLKILRTVSQQPQTINPELKYRLKAGVALKPSFWINEFEIDLGSADGVEVGNVITNKQGQILGIVSSASDKSSEISTITNPKTRLAVWVKNDTNKGLLSGLYGYSSEVDWIRDGQDLANEGVYTTSFLKNTTANLYIGRATNPRIGKSGSFYTIDVTDLANVWNTDGEVLVW